MLPRVSATVTIPKTELQRVFANLQATGLTLIGPTLRQNTIILAEIASVDDLPAGWADEQTPGRYKTRHTGQSDWFGYAVGPGAWQGFLYPPRVSLFRAKAGGSSIEVDATQEPPPRYALIGVRPCDLQALRIADRVLLGGPFQDPHYAARRNGAFLFAVNCSRPSSNCFCSSMGCGPSVASRLFSEALCGGGGPSASSPLLDDVPASPASRRLASGPPALANHPRKQSGHDTWASGAFDLAATELDDALVIEVGSDAGSNAMEGTAWTASTARDLDRAAEVIRQAERSITRDVRTDHLRSFLFENLESPHWKDVASRCLGCGNCTMVCPTCFCTTVTDSIGLSERTERIRLWDSCFNGEFSHVHGGNARPSIRARYRQWLTHKFAGYKEQFGVIGCVGCGRCITWCPAGIDVTEELKALRATGVK
ncbi:MAG: 4Fe-4S dicluster domain-containing protein [Thermoanaerobaculia bacterium]